MFHMECFNFRELPTQLAKEMFSLRCETFKKRLNWRVVSENDMEFDEYDNVNASYLLGICLGQVVCGVRLIDLKYPTMILNTFKIFFGEIVLPNGRFLESSRIFVDKQRARNLLINKRTISLELFLSMIKYARSKNYDGILTLVNYPMLKILFSTGWGIEVLQEGVSEVQQRVFIIKLPIDLDSEGVISEKIFNQSVGRVRRNNYI